MVVKVTSANLLVKNLAWLSTLVQFLSCRQPESHFDLVEKLSERGSFLFAINHLSSPDIFVSLRINLDLYDKNKNSLHFNEIIFLQKRYK